MELNSLQNRQNQLSHLETYLNEVDTEVTMILQSLQWDRKHLLEQKTMVPCQYNETHRIPPDKLMEHESGCFLKSLGYMEKDCLLPSPVDPDASTLVKLDTNNIAEIINNASRYQPLFRTGPGCSGNQPLTLERLQSTYTADERRAIHDAVVAQVPSSHDLSDLDLLSSKDESKEAKPKSQLEILAELRDMKRRRTKYRVAAKTRNYSDVLRDVINTQMELYTQAQDSLMSQIEKVRLNIKKEVTEDYYPNDKNTTPNLDTKLNGDTYGKVSHHYESRKRRRNDTYDESNSATSLKTHERDRSTTCKINEHRSDMSHASNSKRNDYSTSSKKDDRDVKYSRTNRDGHKYYDHYERRKKERDINGDHRRENHSKTDNQQSTVKKATEKHSYYGHSYSSDDNNSEYTETSNIYANSERTHHSHKARSSKVDKERQIYNVERRKNTNGHNLQVEGNIVVKKAENINKEESDVSDYNEGDLRGKYKSHRQRHKKKCRDNESYRRQQHREIEKQTKGKDVYDIRIKALDSSKDDEDDRTDVSYDYHSNRGSYYKYDRYDSSYSKSHKERPKKYVEHANSRRYENSSDKYREYKKK